jgi:hypothetical protein
MSDEPEQPVIPEPEPRFDTRPGKPFITIDIPDAQLAVLQGISDDTEDDS